MNKFPVNIDLNNIKVIDSNREYEILDIYTNGKKSFLNNTFESSSPVFIKIEDSLCHEAIVKDKNSSLEHLANIVKKYEQGIKNIEKVGLMMADETISDICYDAMTDRFIDLNDKCDDDRITNEIYNAELLLKVVEITNENSVIKEKLNIEVDDVILVEIPFKSSGTGNGKVRPVNIIVTNIRSSKLMTTTLNSFYRAFNKSFKYHKVR